MEKLYIVGTLTSEGIAWSTVSAKSKRDVKKGISKKANVVRISEIKA